MPRATREPLVRTVHSYAFAVLRLQASAHGNPPPRLITGAEQDAVLRELLRGDIDDGAGMWPERLRPALGMTGFAVELRDLMLRANERGLGPEDLVALGERRTRPEWVAAGRFAERYEQVMLLRGAVGLEAPEATAPALDAANWSVRRSRRSRPIPICWPPSAAGSAICSSTTPSISIRRPPTWSA
ncbi:hypothetical protein NJ76_12690 [Rhodococcus sp. IITR03]|nr:hypothetical protein NJ76_12690 [Rhodococcus sp. IITR03]